MNTGMPMQKTQRTNLRDQIPEDPRIQKIRKFIRYLQVGLGISLVYMLFQGLNLLK